MRWHISAVTEMSAPRGGFLDIAGERLEWAGWGPPPDEAPTLVFLHEGLGCVALWRDFPERLAALTGWGAFAYSRSGYGRSSPCALPRPLTYMHREGEEILPAVLEAAGIRSYVHVGHSDGGSIALIHAGHKQRPGLHGLITEAAHVFNEDICVRAIQSIRERFEAHDLRARLAKYHGDNTDCAFFGWCDAWLDPGFLAWNLETYLPDVRVPWLVIQGADDDYGTLAQVDAIERKAAGPCERFVPDGCRHAPHVDRPDLLLERMATFVREIDVTEGA